jgi:flagellar motor switch protein FliN/FliY
MSEADDNTTDDWAAALQEQQQAARKLSDTRAAPPPTARAEPVSYENLEDDTSYEAYQPTNKSGEVNLDLLLDIPVMIAMEIGRTKINIRNLLQLTQGSVIELDRLAGEPMDVMVNGTLIAHGEVVVVNEKFGIRLTDVISPSERVKKLK